MGIFGIIWWIVGLRGSGYPTVAIWTPPLLVATVLLLAAFRSRGGASAEPPDESARTGRLVGIASATEGVLILIAVNILGNTGTTRFVVPVIAIIVGAHFLPLAHWLPVRLYYATAALLITLGVAGLAISDLHLRRVAVSCGAACILWLTSADVLWLRRALPRASSLRSPP